MNQLKSLILEFSKTNDIRLLNLITKQRLEFLAMQRQDANLFFYISALFKYLSLNQNCFDNILFPIIHTISTKRSDREAVIALGNFIDLCSKFLTENPDFELQESQIGTLANSLCYLLLNDESELTQTLTVIDEFSFLPDYLKVFHQMLDYMTSTSEYNLLSYTRILSKIVCVLNKKERDASEINPFLENELKIFNETSDKGKFLDALKPKIINNTDIPNEILVIFIQTLNDTTFSIDLIEEDLVKREI